MGIYTVHITIEGDANKKVKHTIGIEAKNIIRASAQAKRLYKDKNYFVHDVEVQLNPTYTY